MRRVLLLVLVAWAGFNLRASVLGVPPLLDRIGADLGMGHAAQGLLTSLPVLCFGLAAIPGSAIVRRIGGQRTVALGLALVVVGSAVRSLDLGPGHGLIALFAGTAALGSGIGIAQPAMPRILRIWMPGNADRASVVVTLGYIIGQLVAAAIALPLLADHLGGWRPSLAFWAVPAAAALIWWAWHDADAGDPPTQPRLKMRTLLRSRQLWTIAVMMACTNLAFFTSNTWLATSAPGGAEGSAAEIDIIVLNAVALPVAAVLAILRLPFVRSRRFYLMGAIPLLVGAIGWMLTPAWGPLWMALIGAGSSLAFSGLVAFPATIRHEVQIAPFSALVWTVGCCGAFVGPFAGGIAIDTLHWNAAPFLAIGIAGVAMTIGALTLPTGHEAHHR